MEFISNNTSKVRFTCDDCDAKHLLEWRNRFPGPPDAIEPTEVVEHYTAEKMSVLSVNCHCNGRTKSVGSLAAVWMDDPRHA